MTEFLVQIDGGRGTLLVDGEQPDLFGELVGCDIRCSLPEALAPGRSRIDRITASPGLGPVVEVTLRLPLGSSDHFTLARGTHIEDLRGPTADAVAAEPVLTRLACTAQPCDATFAITETGGTAAAADAGWRWRSRELAPFLIAWRCPEHSADRKAAGDG